jgi:4-hydroxy-2-oxoheptanedioate aldolase
MTGLLDRLRGDDPLYGVWCNLPGPVGVELVAGLRPDYVVIDLQHGWASEADLAAMIGAATASGVFPIVRPRYKDFAAIGRALDLGAHGVLVPNLDSVEEVRAVAAACAYPPSGTRSFGPMRALHHEPACLVMVESAAALNAIEDIARLPGVHGLYVGPYDLGLALGVTPGDLDHPAISAAIDRILAASALPVGAHATTGAAAARLRQRGCRILTVASDVSALTTAVRRELHEAGVDAAGSAQTGP